MSTHFDPLASHVARRYLADLQDSDRAEGLMEIGRAVQKAIDEMERAVLDLEVALLVGRARLTKEAPVDLRADAALGVRRAVERVRAAEAVLFSTLRQAQAELDKITPTAP
jgi:hypothetical protein